MRTEMDYLVLGTYVLRKSDQPALLKDANWREEFALD
jgi:carbamoyltransferase